MKFKLLAALGAIALAQAGLPPVASAQETGPVTIIVPFAPGGSNDIVTRVVADQLTKDQGRPFVIVNKPGGAGTIGLGDLVRAAPDGRTYAIANISFGVNPFTIADIAYDAQKDFAPVGLMAVVPLVLSVNPKVQARNVQEFVDLVKTQPGKLNYATAGYMTTGHLAMVLFSHQTGIKMNHVPYKGGASQLAAANGEVAGLFSTIATTKQAINSGQLIALGVTTAERDPGLPNVPTIAEGGIKGFAIYDWIGLLAPKGTPKAIVDKMNAAIVQALSKPEVRERIEAVGGHVSTSTPEQMQAHIAAELARWKEVVAATGIKAE